MYPLLQPINYVTVNDMYNFSQLKNSPLLSDFDADFWTEYRNNYPRYDSLFKRMFKGFRYFDQSSYTEDDKDEAIENVTNDFTDQVYLHLMMNRKRYSELYRIWDIDDENYSVTTGYLYNETHTETGTKSGSVVEGSRNDSKNSVKGSETDTENMSHGARSNSYTHDKGGHSDTETLQKGAYTDSVVTDNQAYTDNQTHQIQGFNSSEWQNADKNINENGAQKETETTQGGARNDTKTTQYGQHSDTDSESLGAYTDTNSRTLGQRSDNESFSKGEQTNTDESEYERTLTIKRDGNIGNQSVTDILEKHEKYWNRFNFYKLIFADICKEMLLVN